MRVAPLFLLFSSASLAFEERPAHTRCIDPLTVRELRQDELRLHEGTPARELCAAVPRRRYSEAYSFAYPKGCAAALRARTSHKSPSELPRVERGRWASLARCCEASAPLAARRRHPRPLRSPEQGGPGPARRRTRDAVDAARRHRAHERKRSPSIRHAGP